MFSWAAKDQISLHRVGFFFNKAFKSEVGGKSEGLLPAKAAGDGNGNVREVCEVIPGQGWSG